MTAPTLSSLARHGRLLAEQIATLTTELEEVKRRIRAAIPVGESIDVDDKPVTVGPNRRWNERQALTVIPEPLLPLCQVTKLDSATAKRNLPPDLYEQCMVEAGEPVVRGLS